MSIVSAEASFHYFAYGSNMLTQRLTVSERAPSALFVCIGYVTGRRLAFDKVSIIDGSGKCDAELTSQETDRVYGVVFAINASDRATLDKAEGLNNGYSDDTLEVVTDTGSIFARSYVATKKDSSLKPFHWYKALVEAGAAEHNLPESYLEGLSAFESIEDPDENRKQKNEALLLPANN